MNKFKPVIINATYPGYCPFSDKKIRPGDKICKYTQEQYEAYLEVLSKQLYRDMAVIIAEQSKFAKRMMGKWGHEQEVNFLFKLTKSGRKTQPKVDKRSYVPGSGFTGCDTYDRGYNRGDFNDYEYVPPETAEDRAFIADEDEDEDEDAEHEVSEEESEEESEEKEETTCWGCRENQPNQMAHTDVGGCLYEPL